VAQLATPPAPADDVVAAFGDSDDAGVEADDTADAEDAGADAEVEVPELAGADDEDPPDEHPAAAATTAPAATAPPTLIIKAAEPNIINHPLFVSGDFMHGRTPVRGSMATPHPLRRRPVSYGWGEITALSERGNRVI